MKNGLFSVNPASVGRSFWIRSCGDRNCCRRATVPLGIDTLIANILVIVITLSLDERGDLSPWFTVAWFSICGQAEKPLLMRYSHSASTSSDQNVYDEVHHLHRCNLPSHLRLPLVQTRVLKNFQFHDSSECQYTRHARTIFCLPLGMISSCGSFRQQKTRVSELSWGVVCVILRLWLSVSVEHRLVTDGQTDTRQQLIPVLASVARVKNEYSIDNI